MTGAASSAEIRCPLCGNRFQDGEGTACVFCGRRAGCAMTACPRCGHEFPRVGAGATGAGQRPPVTGRR